MERITFKVSREIRDTWRNHGSAWHEKWHVFNEHKLRREWISGEPGMSQLPESTIWDKYNERERHAPDRDIFRWIEQGFILCVMER